MAISLTINGVERKAKVIQGTIKIDNVLTRRRDTCNFMVASHTGDSYIPSMGQEVVVSDNGTKIFAGVITLMTSSPSGFGMINHSIQCQDYTRLLDRKLVPDSYRNMTGNEIIADLLANYFPPGFTIANVNAPVLIPYIGFNYKPVARCIEELANLLNYDWYIDYDKDLHFFAKESVLAPFDIQDDSGSYIYDSLTIRKDNSQVRNSIVVRGGEYLGDTFTGQLECNGTDFVFPLPYKFSDFFATLTANPLSVGRDYQDLPDSFDALHNFDEKIIRFKEDDVPSAGSVLVFGGKPNLPVIVKLKSHADIATMSAAEGPDGIYEHLIVDKSINSKEGARQRARAEILTYAETLTEGEFITHTSGLKAGQRITVNSASRSINEDYIINQVSISQHGPNDFKYSVSLITTKTFDLIDVLRGLLFATTKNVEIKEGEVIDLVETADEILTISETTTAQSLNYGVEFSLGTFTGNTTIPQGVRRIFRLNYSPLH